MARYTDEFRAQAVLMLEAAGWPEKRGVMVKTARQLGIKHQTLSNWARRRQNPPPQKLLPKKAFDMMQAIRQEIQAILEEFPHARPDADYKELATAMGILVDKLQLLEGKATERVELLTEQERAERLTDILDAARNRRDERATERIQ